MKHTTFCVALLCWHPAASMHSYAVGEDQTIPPSGKLRQVSAAAFRPSAERAALFCSARGRATLPLRLAQCVDKGTGTAGDMRLALQFRTIGHALHASAGFDSVVAKGVRAPDPSGDKVLELEGRPVTVPVGPPVPAQQFAHSSFLQVSWQHCESCQPRSGGKCGRLWAPRCRCSSLCTGQSVRYAAGTEGSMS